METSKLVPAAMPESAVVATTRITVVSNMVRNSFLSQTRGRGGTSPHDSRHDQRPQQNAKGQHLERRPHRMPAGKAVQFRGQNGFVIGCVFDTQHHWCRSGRSCCVKETQQGSKGK